MNDLAARTRGYLSAIPDYLDQLEGFLRPGSRPQDPDAWRKPTRESGKPPIDLVVVDLAADRKQGWLAWQPGDDHVRKLDQSGWRHGILGTLRNWEFRAVIKMDDLGYAAQECDEADARSVCKWLAEHVEFMIENYRGKASFATDVRRMHGDLMRACGLKPDPVYYCPQCDWVIEPQDAGSWWRCTGCRRTWTYANEIDHLLARQADVVSLRQAALELGRPVKTLQRWKARGWVLPIARRRGVDQYSLAAVRRVAESVRWGVRDDTRVS